MARIDQRTSDRIFDVVNYFIMIIVLIATFYPFYYCIILSFNEGKDAMIPGIYFWPRKFTLENYYFIFNNKLLITAFTNSVLRTVIGTVTSVLFTAMVSYGLSKKKLEFRKFYYGFFIVTMYFSGGLIPYYIVIKNLGLINNFLVYIIPSLFSFYNALLCISYFQTIPESVEEQALIDGAGVFRTFILIVLPISLPILATIALFSAVAQWNSYFDTMIFTSSQKLETLQNLLIKLIREAEYIQKIKEDMSIKGGLTATMINVEPYTIRLATMLVVVFPILLVYPFLQKYFIKGIMIGSVKG